MSIASIALSIALATQGINTAKGVSIESIVTMSPRSNLWRMTDSVNNVVCYILLPAMFEDAPPMLQCVGLGQGPSKEACNLMQAFVHPID